MKFKESTSLILTFFTVVNLSFLDIAPPPYGNLQSSVNNLQFNKKELKIIDTLDCYRNNIRDLPVFSNETRPVITYTEIKPLLDPKPQSTVLDDGNIGYKYKNPKAEKLFDLMVPPKKIQKSNTRKNNKPQNKKNKKEKSEDKPKNIPEMSRIVSSFHKSYNNDPLGPTDPMSVDSSDREKRPKAFSLLPYLGFFIPTISLSLYTSVFTFFIEILSRKFYFFKKLLLILLPVALAIEMFETISFWIRSSAGIIWKFFVGTTIEFIFILELLIHILPLFGLWDIKSGRRMKFYWIHIPLLFTAAFIYSMHVTSNVVSFETLMFVFTFLFPLLFTYAFNLRTTETWYRKITKKLFTKGNKDVNCTENESCLILESTSKLHDKVIDKHENYNEHNEHENYNEYNEDEISEVNKENSTINIDESRLDFIKKDKFGEDKHRMRERIVNLSRFII